MDRSNSRGCITKNLKFSLRIQKTKFIEPPSKCLVTGSAT